MKRMNLLAVGLLAVLLAACGGSSPSESTAASEDDAPSVEAPESEAPASEAAESEAAEPSDDGGSGSSGTPLADLLPDNLGGQARQDIDLFDDQTLAAMFAQQGVEVGDVDFLIATYGDSGLGVTAIRVPDMEQANMEMLARLMAGMPETQGSTETAEIGGKTVIAITPDGSDEVGYLYFADGAAFVIAGGSEDQAAELLSQLP
jgi:hypothetical protein